MSDLILTIPLERLPASTRSWIPRENTAPKDKRATCGFSLRYFAGGTVERSCTIPTGTALFFPLINAFYGAFLNDPPETRTEAFLRAQVACTNVVLSAEIDGTPVSNPLQYFEQSPLFDVQLPDEHVFLPNVVPQLLLSPSVDAGYYLFLTPLPPGEHTIHWTASQLCPFGEFAQEVTYHITVR